jgi:hypothetical protein
MVKESGLNYGDGAVHIRRECKISKREINTFSIHHLKFNPHKHTRLKLKCVNLNDIYGCRCRSCVAVVKIESDSIEPILLLRQ